MSGLWPWLPHWRRPPLRRSLLPLFFVIIAAIPAVWPLYALGLPRSFDGGLHLLRIAALERQITAGHWLPRWSPDLMLGYGYPLFNFYAPAGYYGVLLLDWVGLNLYSAFITAFVATVLAAAIGMYLLCYQLFAHRRSPAVIAAVVYAYSPYLLTNIYIRGALAEAAAQSLLPWILWLTYRLFMDDRPGRTWPWFVLMLATLAVTHNITLLFLPPVLLLFILILWARQGFRRQRMAYVIPGLALAMAVSAFFWLPLLVERQYLARTAFDISKTVWLPGSVWRWDNFLDGGLTFEHTFDRPIRLGLVQLCMALAGVALARRHDPLWLLFIAISIFAALLMTAWALPIWLSVDILSVAQFTWRLLSILSLTLAILSGGIALVSPRPFVTAPIAIAVAGLAVFAGAPRVDWMDRFTHDTISLGAPIFAQTELEKGILLGGEGNSSIQEFRPRWASRTLLAEQNRTDVISGASNLTLKPRSGNGYSLIADVTADSPTALRLATFYYPAWQVQLDGTSVSPYPTGELGLLTVDIPSGEHVLTVSWGITNIQRYAGWASVVALLTVLVASIYSRSGSAVVLCIGIVIVVALGSRVETNAAHITSLSQSTGFQGMQMAGFRTEIESQGVLYLYPYWHIVDSLEDDIVLRFRLLTPSGDPITTVESEPYFNTLPATALPQGALFDDAYRITLPADMQAGTYLLSVSFLHNGELLQEATVFGEVVLPAAQRQSPRFQEVDVHFGDSIKLLGYAIEDDIAVHPASTMPVVRAGSQYRQYLYWNAGDFIETNYHAFVHLVDQTGAPVAQEDQLPGPIFSPPRLWTENEIVQDSYLLRIPSDTSSGLYYPMVGMYDFADLDRLPVQTPDSGATSDRFQRATGDHYLLPPLKILGPSTIEPEVTADVRFGDFSRLAGYTLQPGTTLSAGSSLTVTLFYEGLQTDSANLTRFVQLYDPERGVVAQMDSPPVSGHNPTWSWLPNETIVDPVSMLVHQDAPPGQYQLYVGFYDPADMNRRIPVYTGDVPLDNDWAPLTRLVVES